MDLTLGARSLDDSSSKTVSMEKGKVIAQWAKDVTDFSSQYGSENSISYTVSNIIGPSSIYPRYGDFTHSAVLRTYGPWWNMSPSACKPFRRTPDSFISQDFIELLFEHEVFPTKIEIYETYNPGAMVRILACNSRVVKGFLPDNGGDDNLYKDVCWFVLWEGKPTNSSANSRIVTVQSPRECPFPTDTVRIEFNSTLCDYYTELDAVKLHGRLPERPHSQYYDTEEGTDIDELYKLKMAKERPKSEEEQETQESITETLAKLHLQEIDGLSAALDTSDNGPFDLLPGEVLQEIISFLDLPSLCQLARVSQLFYKHCHDPLQFKQLTLHPYWHLVTDSMLVHFTSRCRHLQKLDMSWCGPFHTVTADVFTELTASSGEELTHLRLANCGFVNNDVVQAFCHSCPNIEELDLQNCGSVDNFGCAHISHLRNLKHLNLYRSMIDIHSLMAIIRSCNQLEVLNLGSCSNVIDYDDVAAQLALHCKKLRCLDVWRARSLTEIGLNDLSHNCRFLEELDLGWCSALVSSSGCFVELFRRCNNLKKVFLTANRTVCDRDLEALATFCPHMEQLDVLGTREVSEHVAQIILEKCPNLKMFDVSFCTGISFHAVNAWRAAYPHVAIKKSFQNS